MSIRKHHAAPDEVSVTPSHPRSPRFPTSAPARLPLVRRGGFQVVVGGVLVALLASGVGVSASRASISPVSPASPPVLAPEQLPVASGGTAAPGRLNDPGTNPYRVLKAPKSDGRLHLVLASPKGQLRLVTKSTELRWVFDRPIVALSTIDQGTGQAPGTSQTRIAALANAGLKKYVQIEPAVEGSLRWSSTRVLYVFLVISISILSLNFTRKSPLL